MRQLKVTQSITVRETISLEKYLLEISRIELLTPEEETTLGREAKAGSASAVEKLAKGNLRFVVSVAKQYQYRGFPLIDLINEGNIGLMRAAQNFDETRGFKFISYAVWWIRQAIIQAINDKGRLVRIPGNKINLFNNIHRSTDRLAQSLERHPSEHEIAGLLGIKETELTHLQGSLFHISLDAPSNDENSESTLLNKLCAPDDESTEGNLMHLKSLQIELERCLATLPPVQNKILKLLFGLHQKEPMSLSKIACELNLSEERIRQLKQKALIQLRMGKKTELLRSYLN